MAGRYRRWVYLSAVGRYFRHDSFGGSIHSLIHWVEKCGDKGCAGNTKRCPLKRTGHYPVLFFEEVLHISLIIIPLVAAGCLVDIKKGIIPKWCTVPVFILGVLHNALLGGWYGVIGSLLGALGVVTVYLSMHKVLKIGFGDIKLLMGAGAYAGIEGMPILLIFMLTISSLMMVARFIRVNKTYTPLSFYRAAVNQLKGGPTVEKIPFAPYIGVPFVIFLVMKNVLTGRVI